MTRGAGRAAMGWCGCLAALALLGISCTKDHVGASSTTGGLACETLTDCAAAPAAVACSNGQCVDDAGKPVAKSNTAPDGASDPSTLRIGDRCNGRELPEGPQRPQSTPNLLVPTGTVLPDGAIEPIDAAPSEPPAGYIPASTPVCLITAADPDGYYSWVCGSDDDCPTGTWCDSALASAAAQSPDEDGCVTGQQCARGYCRVSCESDDDCHEPFRCGEASMDRLSSPRRCDCVGCIYEWNQDGGPRRLVRSTCGPCFGFWCCDDACLDLLNDDRNCGGCGNVCEGDLPICDYGKCAEAPCYGEVGAAPPTCDRCCGMECCGEGERCCSVPNGFGPTYVCHPADKPCPMGCPTCICAAPDTPVDTPDGPRAIGEIVVGDLVYSVEDGERVVAPVVRVNRADVPPEHAMVRVTFADGSAIELSPGHPTADGRTFADLSVGDALGTREVGAIELVPYDGTYTVDILPATRSGAYFAGGALVGSTLSGGSP